MINPPKPNDSFIRQLDVVSKWAECKTPQCQSEFKMRLVSKLSQIKKKGVTYA